MKTISSRENAEYKALRQLLESARARRSEHLTVLEGAHLVRAASESGRELLAVYACSDCDPESAALLETLPEARIRLLDAALLGPLTSADPVHGVLALIEPVSAQENADPGADWLVLDGVQDAGNVGTLMRTAAAAGVREVLLGPGCAQAWSPKVLRAGMGAHFCLKIHELPDLAAQLARHRGRIAVTRLDGATDLYALDLLGPVAWVFGSEGQGVSDQIARLAQLGVLIPMAPGIESLNVAAAAAICLFEQRRQRLRA